jgi:hypothetical protein
MRIVRSRRFPDLRLVMEVGGWTGHFAPEKRGSDHRRDRTLRQAES